MNPEPQTIEEYRALFELLHEEAGKDNSLLGRSDSLALQNIRKLLEIPKHGYQDISNMWNKN